MGIRRKYTLFAFVVLIILASPTRAHALGGVPLTAFTGSNVTVDGVNSGSEWSDAFHQGFAWTGNNSSLTSGGDLWVKNNGTSLLIAVETNGQATRSQADFDSYLYNLCLLFDNNDNGLADDLEDAKCLQLMFPSASPTTVQLYDDLRFNSAQGIYSTDAYSNGTAAGSHSNPGGSGVFTWEFAISMVSTYTEDFTLAVGGSIGFEIVFSEQHYFTGNFVSSGWAYWQVAYPNGLPSGPSPSASGWASILRTASQAPPDTSPPTINTPSIQPVSPGQSDLVTVSVQVTDTGSGVKNVTITYTTDSWNSINTTLVTTYDPGSQVATVKIPAQQGGTHVAYYVVAFDYAGNRALNNNGGSFFGYDTSMPQPSPGPWYLSTWFFALLGGALAAFLLALFLRARRKSGAIPLASTISG